MRTLPNLPVLMDNEYLLSYLARTAKVNVIPLRDMLELYMDMDLQKYQFIALTRFPLFRLLDALDVEDHLSFILKTTTYPLDLCFRTDGEQALKLLPLILLENDLAELLPGYYCHHVPLRLCTECMQEDWDTRHVVYYHRAHQIPFVRVCHKHGCVLQDVRPTRAGVLFSDLELTPCTETVLEGEVEFARFIYALMQLIEERRLVMPARTLKGLVLDTLLPGVSGSISKKLPMLSDIVLHDRLWTLFEDDRNRFRQRMSSSLKSNLPYDLSYFLLYLACAKGRDMSVFTRHAAAASFSSRPCPLCGRSHPVSAMLESYGLGCPLERLGLDMEDFIRGLFGKGLFPDYELKEIDLRKRRLTVVYRPSGTVYERSIKAFMFDKASVHEKIVLRPDEIDRIIQRSSGGVLCLDAVDRKAGNFTVRCLSCGNRKTYAGNQFSRIKICPNCKRRAKAPR